MSAPASTAVQPTARTRGRGARQRRRPGLTMRGTGLLVLAVIALAVGSAARWPGLIGVGIAAAVAVLIAVLGLVSRRTAGIRRDVPDVPVRRLDPVRATVTPVVRGGSGDEIELRERVDGVLLPAVRLIATRDGRGVQHPVPTQIPGEVTLGPAEIRYFGFAGLARMRVHDAARDSVLVLARALPVRLPDNGALPVDTVHGDEIEGGGTELRSLRPYIPGDDLRKVSARISARMGRLMIRQDSEPAISTVTVVVDNGEDVALDRLAEMLDVATSLVGAAHDQGLPVRWTARGRPGPAEVDADGIAVTERLLACLRPDADGIPRIGPSDLTVVVCGPTADAAELTDGLIAPDHRGLLVLARITGAETVTDGADRTVDRPATGSGGPAGAVVLAAPTAEMVLRGVSRLDRLVAVR